MGWLSVTLEADCAHAEAAGDALMEAGALSATIEDAAAGTRMKNRSSASRGHHDAGLGPFANRRPVRTGCRILPLPSQSLRPPANCPKCPPFTTEAVAEQNWVQLTQSQFDPIRVSERLWIVPSWHDAPDPAAINLILDPGMAFGTGSHPTTRLCLEWLERSVRPGESLLDYGCGSGILAIAGAGLGACPVDGVDIDPQAVLAAEANAERNNVSARFFDSTDRSAPATTASLPTSCRIRSRCWHRPSAAMCVLVEELALSGILAEQAEELMAIYSRSGYPCTLPTVVKAGSA